MPFKFGSSGAGKKSKGAKVAKMSRSAKKKVTANNNRISGKSAGKRHGAY